MASSNYIKNVAVFGASGNLGSLVVSALLDANRFNVKVFTRASSSATFPTSSSLTVQAVDYASSSAIAPHLKGQDAVIVIIGFTAPPEIQTTIIDAAAAAGVPWLLPCEFGSDGANNRLVDAIPLLSHKRAPRERAEQLGLKWIGIVNNPWLDFSLARGAFGIDIAARTAELYDGGNTKFNTTLTATTALAIARLLSLPVAAGGGDHQPALADYANKFCYIKSFLTSQNELLAAVQKATGTSDADWTVTHTTAKERVRRGGDKLAKGDVSGMLDLLYGCTFDEGVGNEYESERPLSNKALGLPEPDLDDAVAKIVKDAA